MLSKYSESVIILYRIIVRILSRLLRMMCHLMNTASLWRRMVHGHGIWSCKQLLLLPEEIFVFIRQVQYWTDITFY